MGKKSTYLWPGKVQFGSGAAQLIAEEAPALGGTSLFVIIDPGVYQVGLLESALAKITEAGLTAIIYNEVVPNPDLESVHAAAHAFRDSGASILVGFGGGSALDTAKAVKLLAGGPRDAKLWEYATALGIERRAYPLRQEMPPFIAVPTTAGTGAEATPWAVITDPQEARKFGVGDTCTIPEVALVDPDLTLALPAHLTAATGMDALSHLVEAYVSTNHNPILDPLILAGIEMIGSNLRTAVFRGDDQTAREMMMQASLIGGIAISSKWLGACHSLAHPLSGMAGLHHGLACGITLPHQMSFSLMGSIERYADIAAALDERWLEAGSRREMALGAPTAVTELMTDIGLPTRLSEVGVNETLIPALAKAAYTDLNWWTNPCYVNEEAMESMYRAAL